MRKKANKTAIVLPIILPLAAIKRTIVMSQMSRTDNRLRGLSNANIKLWYNHKSLSLPKAYTNSHLSVISLFFFLMVTYVTFTSNKFENISILNSVNFK